MWGNETPYDRLEYTVSTQIALMCGNLFDKFSKDNDNSAQPRAALTGNQRYHGLASHTTS